MTGFVPARAGGEIAAGEFGGDLVDGEEGSPFVLTAVEVAAFLVAWFEGFTTFEAAAFGTEEAALLDAPFFDMTFASLARQ